MQLFEGLGIGLRTLATIQLFSLVNFLFIKSLLNLNTVGSLFASLFITVQVATICIITIISSSAQIAPAGLQLLIGASGLGVIQSLLEITRVFGYPPYTWIDALFTSYYLALNTVIFCFSVYLRGFFSWPEWNEAIEKYGQIGSLFGSAYSDVRAAIDSRAYIYFFSEIFIPAESVTLFVYFVAIGALGNNNYNITGWVYALHIFGIISAIVWHEQTRSFKNRTATQQQLGLGIVSPPSFQGLASIYVILFVIEACQLIYVQSNDHPQLVVLRSFLCVFAGLYVVVICATGVHYEYPVRAVVIFYGIQLCIAIITTVDAFWTTIYFCYAQAIHTPYNYANLAHTVSFSAGLAAVFVAKKPLDAVAGLGVIACLVLCVDIVVLAYNVMQDRAPSVVFVQVVFLLISVCYIAVVAIIWPGSSDQDSDKYIILLDREQLTAESLIGVIGGSYIDDSKLKTQGEVDEWRGKVARRIYYLITGPIKTVGIIDVLLVIFYTIILSVDTETGGSATPEWYQWFYLLHYITFFSATVTSTFELGFDTSLLFLAVMAIACLVIDCVLMGYLANIVSIGEICIQSGFIACDVLYIIFFFMTVSHTDPESLAILSTMKNLDDRLATNNKIK